MYVSRDLEWTVLQELCRKLESLDTHPDDTLLMVISPDYSATVGMHVAHHLSKDGEMLDMIYVDVPYPDEDATEYQRNFLSQANESGIKRLHYYKNVILIEAGVITGGNYTWLTHCLDVAGITYKTAALFENIDSKYKSNVVGRYYKESDRQLEFYWEKPNKHW
jgi:hypothetical protein